MRRARGEVDRRWRDGGSSRSNADRRWRDGGSARGDRDVVRRVADRQWRDGGSARGSSRDSRSSSRYRDGGDARYKPSGPIIRSGGDVHYTRNYYTSDFYRPRYVARSGFWLGLSIGTYPAYGYRYWDPYCGLHFSSLVPYYSHCHGHGHPSAIVIIDYRSHAPIATCVYDDGGWVVDDCAHDDYAYEDECDDDEVYYEEY